MHHHDRTAEFRTRDRVAATVDAAMALHLNRPAKTPLRDGVKSFTYRKICSGTEVVVKIDPELYTIRNGVDLAYAAWCKTVAEIHVTSITLKNGDVVTVTE